MKLQQPNNNYYAGTVNKAGDTPLSLACANGHLDTVKYIVNEHRCDPKSNQFNRYNYHAVIIIIIRT